MSEPKGPQRFCPKRTDCDGNVIPKDSPHAWCFPCRERERKAALALKKTTLRGEKVR